MLNYQDLRYGDPIAVIDRTRPLFEISNIYHVVHVWNDGVVAYPPNSIYVTWVDRKDILGVVLDVAA